MKKNNSIEVKQFVLIVIMAMVVLTAVIAIFNLRLPAVGHAYYAAFGNLGDYPDLLIKDNKLIAEIVVGNKAPASDVVSVIDIATSIKAAGAEVGDAKLADEISDPLYADVISIGNACNNEITAKILGDPKPCYKELEEGKAAISLYNYNDRVQILVYGKLDDDTRRAARVLKYYNDYDLDGNDVCVTGTLGNPKAENKKCEITSVPVEVPVENVEQETPAEVYIEEQTAEQQSGTPAESNAETASNSEEGTDGEELSEESPINPKQTNFLQKILDFFKGLFGG